MGRGGLAALKVAVAVMGVLIVAGVVVLVVTMTRRLSGPVVQPASVLPASVLLDEPAGTALAGAALSGDRLVLQLRGGGPDRVVVVDLRGGAPARVGLAR